MPDIQWEDLSLGVAVILVLGFFAVKLLDVWAKKITATPTIPSEVIQVIKENTEVNARLVTTVEAQTRLIQSVQEGQNGLLLAITRLIAKIEGSA